RGHQTTARSIARNPPRSRQTAAHLAPRHPQALARWRPGHRIRPRRGRAREPTSNCPTRGRAHARRTRARDVGCEGCAQAADSRHARRTSPVRGGGRLSTRLVGASDRRRARRQRPTGTREGDRPPRAHRRRRRGELAYGIGAPRMSDPIPGIDSPTVAARAGRIARTTFLSLRNRNFRLYFIGQLISNSGNWLTNIALTLLILHLTNSGLDVGLLAACQYGPMLLLSAYAGAIADRVD